MVNNNPINSFDPDGLAGLPARARVGGGGSYLFAGDFGGGGGGAAIAIGIGLIIKPILPNPGKLYSDAYSKDNHRKLSDKELKDRGLDAEEIKKQIGAKPGGHFDLFVDKNGKIIVKPKSGIGPGEDTGYNLNDYSCKKK